MPLWPMPHTRGTLSLVACVEVPTNDVAVVDADGRVTVVADVTTVSEVVDICGTNVVAGSVAIVDADPPALESGVLGGRLTIVAVGW